MSSGYHLLGWFSGEWGAKHVPEGTYMEPQGHSKVYLGAWKLPSVCKEGAYGSHFVVVLT